jgi:hypothetical protein
MRRITGHGLEQHGDWSIRVSTRLAAYRHLSVTSFVESSPGSSLIELAARLNECKADDDPLPVSADQLAQLWRQEASRAGSSAFERLARHALVSELHRHLLDGWPAEINEDTSFLLTHAQITWTSLVGREWKEQCDNVWRILEQRSPPPKWLPEDVNDPLIVASFEGWSSTAKKRLKYVGNFQELGFSDIADAPGLALCRGKLRIADKRQLVEYLQAAPTFVAAFGVEPDIFDPGKVAGSSSYATDGTYLWPRVLSYYVDRYDVDLPVEFLAHGEAIGWRIPTHIDSTTLKMPEPAR